MGAATKAMSKALAGLRSAVGPSLESNLHNPTLCPTSRLIRGVSRGIESMRATPEIFSHFEATAERWSSFSPPVLSPCPLQSPRMLDTMSSQYDSFIYWRMPIPRLDVAELEGLGLADVALYKPKAGLGQRERLSQDLSLEEEDTLLPFNTFNFWRAPIASISSLDFDLI
ncbi:myeloid/lymphoid or mixed-lineage leukemia [Pitangus sulphuratus]|nr:myeloid/lymphoid or mixed-lineage leukemia [Pitangus sulphuratus]